MMAPFVSKELAGLMGFEDGGKTGLLEYAYRTKIISPPNSTLHGATYYNSIYWRFVSIEIYEKLAFVNFLKTCILICNVYYFFLR